MGMLVWKYLLMLMLALDVIGVVRQLDVEQSPQGLPFFIQERDFKAYKIGAAGNPTHCMLLLESFKTPMFVRVVAWNESLRQLKGIKKSVFVNLGGLLTVVSVMQHRPLCVLHAARFQLLCCVSICSWTRLVCAT